MPEITTRTMNPLRPAWGNLFSWDPFRDVVPNWSQVSGLEIVRNETGYVVEVPVAGFKPEEVSVTLEDGVLTIVGSAEKRKFTRSLLLPDEIDIDRVEALVEHGLLTLTLPFHPKAAPKKIEIKYTGN